MKDLIGSGLFFLLFLFGIFTPIVDKDYSHELEMQAVMMVENHRQMASFEGIYDSVVKDSLTSKIAALYNLDESDITITADETVKYRNSTFVESDLIQGTLTFDEKNVFTTARFLSIAPEDNVITHVYDLTVASEAIRP